jgi:hypothetical protein
MYTHTHTRTHTHTHTHTHTSTHTSQAAGPRLTKLDNQPHHPIMTHPVEVHGNLGLCCARLDVRHQLVIGPHGHTIGSEVLTHGRCDLGRVCVQHALGQSDQHIGHKHCEQRGVVRGRVVQCSGRQTGGEQRRQRARVRGEHVDAPAPTQHTRPTRVVGHVAAAQVCQPRHLVQGRRQERLGTHGRQRLAHLCVCVCVCVRTAATGGGAGVARP